jgi:hypothetical protein
MRRIIGVGIAEVTPDSMGPYTVAKALVHKSEIWRQRQAGSRGIFVTATGSGHTSPLAGLRGCVIAADRSSWSRFLRPKQLQRGLFRDVRDREVLGVETEQPLFRCGVGEGMGRVMPDSREEISRAGALSPR